VRYVIRELVDALRGALRQLFQKFDRGARDVTDTRIKGAAAGDIEDAVHLEGLACLWNITCEHRRHNPDLSWCELAPTRLSIRERNPGLRGRRIVCIERHFPEGRITLSTVLPF
jgi:hypothetical protein